MIRKLSMDELQRKTVAEFRQSQKHNIIIVLENIRSMHNVGSIFRTADAFLIQSMYLCGYTPKPPHRDINKTALGATETVDWKFFTETRDALERLRHDGFSLWAVEQAENSIPLNNLTWDNDEKKALIFGNEVEGITKEVLELCDGCIEIPQFGMKHSLNVSVAAGIILWELVRSSILK